jgi:hypothetical protein
MGVSDHQLDQAGIIGRGKAGENRRIAQSHDYLNPHNPLPEKSVLALAFQHRTSLPQQESLAKPYEDQLRSWQAEGIQCYRLREIVIFSRFENAVFSGENDNHKLTVCRISGPIVTLKNKENTDNRPRQRTPE